MEAERWGRSFRVRNRNRLEREPKLVKNSWETTRRRMFVSDGEAAGSVKFAPSITSDHFKAEPFSRPVFTATK